MLIYEKITDGVRHLYGTEGNIPSEDDGQLAYKDKFNDEITDITAYKYFYGTEQLMFANESTNQIPSASDEQINVWLGDTLVIGTELPPASGLTLSVMAGPQNTVVTVTGASSTSATVYYQFDADIPPVGAPIEVGIGDWTEATLVTGGFQISNAVIPQGATSISVVELDDNDKVAKGGSKELA